jgi:hypothetical protein
MSSPLRRGLHANTAGFRLPFHPGSPNLSKYAKIPIRRPPPPPPRPAGLGRCNCYVLTASLNLEPKSWRSDIYSDTSPSSVLFVVSHNRIDAGCGVMSQNV